MWEQNSSSILLASTERKRAHSTTLYGNPMTHHMESCYGSLTSPMNVPKGTVWLGNGVRGILWIHKLDEHLHSNPVYFNDYINLLFLISSVNTLIIVWEKLWCVDCSSEKDTLVCIAQPLFWIWLPRHYKQFTSPHLAQHVLSARFLGKS